MCVPLYGIPNDSFERHATSYFFYFSVSSTSKFVPATSDTAKFRMNDMSFRVDQKASHGRKMFLKKIKDLTINQTV